MYGSSEVRRGFSSAFRLASELVLGLRSEVEAGGAVAFGMSGPSALSVGGSLEWALGRFDTAHAI
jgi:hypothetical protein